jgi:hypothetical protein
MNYLSVITLAGIALSLVIEITSSVPWARAPQNKAVPLIVGRWKLSTEKSNMPPFPQNQFDLREYRLRDDGYLVGLLVTSNQSGYHYLQFTAKSDGKEYPEYSDALLAEMLATGKQTPRTYSETIVDDYVTQWSDKANGRVTGHGTKTISQDGKTMTILTEGSSRMLVYDRQ